LTAPTGRNIVDPPDVPQPGEHPKLPADAPAAPAVLWSERNPERFPPWRGPVENGPGGDEFTLVDDLWFARRADRVERFSSAEMARRIAAALARSAG
jgi:hypothetical protein